VLLEAARVVAHVLARGEGVELAAARLEAIGDLVGGAALRALEQHVLEEVAYADEARRLVAGSGLEPDAQGQRAAAGQRLAQDREAVGKLGALGMAIVDARVHGDSEAGCRLAGAGSNPGFR